MGTVFVRVSADGKVQLLQRGSKFPTGNIATPYASNSVNISPYECNLGPFMNLADDPKILARKERFREHLPAGDDMALIVLKGHLLIEEILLDIIVLHCKKPEALADARLSFSSKIEVARALCGDDLVLDRLWMMVGDLNALRNKLAHKLESPGLDKAVNNFLASTTSAANWVDSNRPAPSKLKDALGFLYGYLAACEIRVAGSRNRGIGPSGEE